MMLGFIHKMLHYRHTMIYFPLGTINGQNLTSHPWSAPGLDLEQKKF